MEALASVYAASGDFAKTTETLRTLRAVVQTDSKPLFQLIEVAGILQAAGLASRIDVQQMEHILFGGKKASRLCAAFVVIGQQENLERDIFWKILRMVRDVGNNSADFLVINNCLPMPAYQIHDELLKLANQNRFGVQSFNLFASYDFTKRGVERFAIAMTDGQLPEGCASGHDDLDRLDSLLPSFFACDKDGPQSHFNLGGSYRIGGNLKKFRLERVVDCSDCGLPKTVVASGTHYGYNLFWLCGRTPGLLSSRKDLVIVTIA